MFQADEAVAEVLRHAQVGDTPKYDVTLVAPVRPFLIASLAQALARPVLAVTSTYRQAEVMVDDLAALLGADAVVNYPAWETLPHERLAPRADTVGRRLEVLRRLAGVDELPAPQVVVAPVRALLQPQAKGLAELRPVKLEVGADYDLFEVARALVAAAYERTDMVARRGEFSLRGGILDVFAPTAEQPVRVDFFGDTVEEIRPFSVADQRSLPSTLPEVVAAPCAEPLTDGYELLIDALPADALIVINDPELTRSRAAELHTTSQEFLQAAWSAATADPDAEPPREDAAYWSYADVRAHALALGQKWWGLSPFATDAPEAEAEPDDEGEPASSTIAIAATEVPDWHADMPAALQAVTQAVKAKHRVTLLAPAKGLARRLAEILAEADVPNVILDDGEADPPRGKAAIVEAELSHGVRFTNLRLDVFTLAEISGSRAEARERRKMPGRRKTQIDPIDLKPGEAIVHERHGVGRFKETITRTVQGVTREYLVIEYAPSKRGHPRDQLFVPMDQLHLLTRYVGGEEPGLDKLGGADWAKRKASAKRAVATIAAELVRLYAARQATRGHAFGPDQPWQAELEESFAFVETPDQLAAISDVKADMEREIPMDRLICGDVGYGKTEIAVRAAFKAVLDGKQVAILCPTTLLTQQHLETFSSRYAGFPVKVAALSRFVSDKQAKKVLDGLASGTIDVVIGTHRLLSGEVHFKDLGLVVIDEEQRFGVDHKEALKKLRLNVDVLAMSATPIPRTLEMAVTGIREMSVIATPPEERHPVLTFAGPYDANQIRAAIRRELAREGQVFYLHNRVSSIDEAAAKLAQLVPEARIAVAHGQMGEKRLEQVMLDFWERKYDVLVSTTIIEAGLDITAANTLVIERADMLGLSQLHQLRGRVGRGRDRGYAYFLYPPGRLLSQTAHDRLATMASNTDLGSGMAIAMKDLEIRGAGNLLGEAQSGHIAEVGFDMYLRLVGEALADYRGDTPEADVEMRIELPVDAHLPVEYVESERLRLELYRRIAAVNADAEIDAIRDELRDRFGPLPPVAETLLQVAGFRLAAKAQGITEVTMQGSLLRFFPVTLKESTALRLTRLFPGIQIRKATDAILVPKPRPQRLGEPSLEGLDLLTWATSILTQLAFH
ncbi:MAG: transcription-repair coupling factor [Propionibacteriaceae bacterium]|nr:transcription-repair coupling factor [Propionibacteriaceae bacterium]